MNCTEARQHWDLYHDSEGDAELHFQINEHLAGCAECAAWFKQQSRLEDILTEKVRTRPAGTELWDQVLLNTGLLKPVRNKWSWMWFAGMAASVALIAGIWLLWQARTSRAADLSKLSAAWHQKVLDGHQPEYRPRTNEPDIEVEKYLRERVNFPVRCPPRKDAGFNVDGAGVCRLAEQPAAYLTGVVDGNPVSIFVLANESLNAFPHQLDAIRRKKRHNCQEGPFQMVMAVIDRNAVVVIGRTDQRRLDRVLSAYGTYPD